MSQEIPFKKLSKRQREVLQIMNDGGDLVCEKGNGWYIDDDRINGKLPMTLLRHFAISEGQFSNDKIQHYNINETGRHSLETGWLYIYKK